MDSTHIQTDRQVIEIFIFHQTKVGHIHLLWFRILDLLENKQKQTSFLPRCMECRRGIAMRKLSVPPSVCPSDKRAHCDKTEERSV